MIRRILTAAVVTGGGQGQGHDPGLPRRCLSRRAHRQLWDHGVGPGPAVRPLTGQPSGAGMWPSWTSIVTWS